MPPHTHRGGDGAFTTHTPPAAQKTAAAQQGCPTAPHGVHVPLWHTSALGFSHEVPPQHGCPFAPQVWHAPATHICETPQRLPQPPQFEVVVSAASQPFALIPSQLPKPAVHATTPHDPLEHVCEATFGRAHARPQLPQCSGDVLVLVSQPLALMESQSAKLPLHDPMPHVPAVHRVEALASDGHTLPHAPQWSLSFATERQLPPQHICEPAHVRPHIPQEVLSFVRLRHTPLQLESDPHPVVVHGGAPDTPQLTHCPPAQTVPAAHARPQEPQWLASEAVLVSQPLAALPSQLANAPLHPTTAHCPPAHRAVALGRLHGLLHDPQCASVLPVATSQPFVTTRSQSP